MSVSGRCRNAATTTPVAMYLDSISLKLVLANRLQNGHSKSEKITKPTLAVEEPFVAEPANEIVLPTRVDSVVDDFRAHDVGHMCDQITALAAQVKVTAATISSALLM
jgi:hypothetical protein